MDVDGERMKKEALRRNYHTVLALLLNFAKADEAGLREHHYYCIRNTLLVRTVLLAIKPRRSRLGLEVVHFLHIILLRRYF